jgi:hypothetical protein
VYSQCGRPGLRPEAAQLHWQVELELELELEVCHDGPVTWCAAAINRGDRDWPSLLERERESLRGHGAGRAAAACPHTNELQYPKA